MISSLVICLVNIGLLLFIIIVAANINLDAQAQREGPHILGTEKGGEVSAIPSQITPSQITRAGIGIMIPSLGNVGATTSLP